MKPLSKIGSLLRDYLNSPKKIGAFLLMGVWAVAIRTLLHNFQTNKVIPLIMQSNRKIDIPLSHITRYLHWLERLSVLHSRGNCLPKSLLLYRFLTLAGAQPTLIIGFMDSVGHAWVELDGKIIGEAPNVSTGYIPTLFLKPDATAFSPFAHTP